MDSSVSPKDKLWFLRVCHYISNAVCQWRRRFGSLKWDRLYSSTPVCPSIIISPMLHTDRRLDITLISRTNGRSLGTFEHNSGFLTLGSSKQKTTCTLFFKF